MTIAMGFVTAAKSTGFDKSNPAQYNELRLFVRDLLKIATIYWLGYIIICAGLAFFWALMVAEPRVASKRRFDERRSKRIGKKR